MNPNVLELVAHALKVQGFDGLYSTECSCEIGDLAPCGDINDYCQAGYRYVCNDDDCEYTLANGEHWHMRSGK